MKEQALMIRCNRSSI